MTQQPIDLSDQLMTVGEVAKIFQVSNYTVRVWIHEDQIKATKIGRRWRIPKSEVTRFANLKYGRVSNE